MFAFVTVEGRGDEENEEAEDEDEDADDSWQCEHFEFLYFADHHKGDFDDGHEDDQEVCLGIEAVKYWGVILKSIFEYFADAVFEDDEL